MTQRLLKMFTVGALAALVGVLAAGVGSGQQPGTPGNPLPLPPGQPGAPAAPAAPADGAEVLAKGPVHEAFATTAEAPIAPGLAKKQPPDAIEELPPDQKPSGDNVQWIPGYWGWDEEGDRYVWVSGFWRQPPPGRVWVPGSWRAATGGWQWVGGFWQEVAMKATAVQPTAPTQPEIQYLAEPPKTLEVGPTVPAPSATHVYVPGAYVWRDGKYWWRPGVWVEYRAGWVWVPARYHWTPAGYVFSEGYWDYPIATRGVLFAPVVYAQPVYVRPTYVYTPAYVVSEPAMMGAMFVRRGYSCYYFGDYYDAPYVERGYTAWCGTYTREGFVVGFGTGRAWGYDPLWSYYAIAYRGAPEWQRGMCDLYHGRYRGELMRPPVTLVQQNTTIIGITKVNVIEFKVVNGAPMVGGRNVSGVAVLAPLSIAADIQRVKFEVVSLEARRNEAIAARQIREVAAQRMRLETAALHDIRPGAGPRSIKLDVPRAAVVRAQVDERREPPPSPHKPEPLHADPKLNPKVDPKLDPKHGPAPKDRDRDRDPGRP
jgi:hypothetical protein